MVEDDKLTVMSDIDGIARSEDGEINVIRVGGASGVIIDLGLQTKVLTGSLSYS